MTKALMASLWSDVKSFDSYRGKNKHQGGRHVKRVAVSTHYPSWFRAYLVYLPLFWQGGDVLLDSDVHHRVQYRGS